MAEQQDGRSLGPDLMTCHAKPGPPTRMRRKKRKKRLEPLISGLKAIFKVKITLKIS